MRDLLDEGIKFFNADRYFEAHECWEDLWRQTSGEPRLFLQGLVQVAVGLHHFSKNNHHGGNRVLRRGLEKLRLYGGSYLGLDNGMLVNDLSAFLSSSQRTAVRIQYSRTHKPTLN